MPQTELPQNTKNTTPKHVLQRVTFELTTWKDIIDELILYQQN